MAKNIQQNANPVPLSTQLRDLVQQASLEAVRAALFGDEGRVAAHTLRLLPFAAQRFEVADQQLAERDIAMSICRYLVEELHVDVSGQVDEGFFRSSLSFAAAANTTALVMYLLEHQAGVNVADKIGQTALFFAAVKGRLENVNVLLQARADPMKQDCQGHTALFYSLHASNETQTSCLQALLDASPAGQAVGTRGTVDGGKTPLFYAVLRATVDTCRVLIDMKSEVDATERSNGQSALFFAAGQGRSDLVQLLVERQASADLRDVNGQSALHYASGNGHDACCIILIEQGGADPFARGSVPGGSTPIELLKARNAPKDLIALCERQRVKPAYLGAELAKVVRTGRRVLGRAPSNASGHSMGSRHSIGSRASGAKRMRKVDEKQVLADLSHAVRREPASRVRLLLQSAMRDLDGGAVKVLHPAGGPPLLHLAASRWPEESPCASSRSSEEASEPAVAVCRIIIEEFGEDANVIDARKKQTALFSAATVGNTAVCRYLLHARCDPTIINSERRNAIFDAVQSLDAPPGTPLDGNGAAVSLQDRACDIITLLARARADANLRDINGRSALFMAIEETRPAIAAVLLDSCGARPPDEGIEPPYVVRDCNGNRDLMEMARERGLPDIVSRLEEVKRKRAASNRFRVLLHAAAVEGPTERLEKLLVEDAATLPELASVGGVFDVNVQGSDGRCALHHALESSTPGSEARADILLKYRALPDIRDHHGQTVLFAAARGGVSAALMRRLLEASCPIEAQDLSGETALFEAAKQNGDRGIAADALVDLGAVVDQRNRLRQTPLFAAAQRGYADVIQTLLGRRASVDAVDHLGRTALFHTHSAVCAARLIDGACGVDVRDSAGETALFAAAKRKLTPLLKLLLERGASAQIHSGGEAHGGTAARPTTREDLGPVSSDLIGKTRSVLSINRLSGGVATTNRAVEVVAGATPLHCAGDRSAIYLLLAARADINARDGLGRTALHTAAARGDIASLRSLAKAGADANLQDGARGTALRYAILQAQPLPVLEVLLFEALASPTAADMAATRRRKDAQATLKLLRSVPAARVTESAQSIYELRFEEEPLGGAQKRPGAVNASPALVPAGTPEYEARLSWLKSTCPWFDHA